MKELREIEAVISDILSLFVYYPQDLCVNSEYQIEAYKGRIDCRRADKGRILGKDGERFFKIKDVVREIARKRKIAYELTTVNVYKESAACEERPPVAKDSWMDDAEKIRLTLERIGQNLFEHDLSVEVDPAQEQATFSVTVSMSEHFRKVRLFRVMLESIAPLSSLYVGHRFTFEVFHTGAEADMAQPKQNDGRFSRARAA